MRLSKELLQTATKLAEKLPRVYLGADTMKLAARIIAVCGNEACERMARFKITHTALIPETAPTVMFWAGVLARARTELAPGECARLIHEMTEDEIAEIDALNVRAGT